jgi:hypothetical protein
MASVRQKFVLRLHLMGLGVVLVLGVVVAVLLGRAAVPDAEGAVLEGTLIFLLVALVVEQLVARFLLENVLKPTGRATNLATRIALGDLSLDTGADGKAGKDALTTSLATMLDKLRAPRRPSR